MRSFLKPKPAMRIAETILIAGGSGYLGRALVRQLLDHGHRVMVASRNPAELLDRADFPQHSRLQTFKLRQSPPHSPTVIINLCGENIAAKRWSKKRKLALLSSRLEPTKWLVERCNEDWQNVHTFINASAIGFYGDHGEQRIIEGENGGNDFASKLCQQWEQCLKPLNKNIRQIYARLGVVIGPPRPGSFIGRLLPSYKFCLGAKLSNGQHWFSWIHRQDAARALCFLVENQYSKGAYNLTAPHPARYERLHYSLSKILKRPNFLCLPEVLIRIIFGEMSQLLLSSQRVLPNRLVRAGFSFQYNALHSALYNAIAGQNSPYLSPPKVLAEKKHN